MHTHTLRYITHPDFHADHVELFIVSDVAISLCKWVLQLHPFVLAARPIEETRLLTLGMRARAKQKQGEAPAGEKASRWMPWLTAFPFPHLWQASCGVSKSNWHS